MAKVFELIYGLQILESYEPDSCIGGASHDIIYGPPVDPDEISEQDIESLTDLGWHLDSETGCWRWYCL